MDARHCAGTEMAELMAYAASVGSDRAKAQGRRRRLHRQRHRRHGAFLRPGAGLGTMPHALIGYAGSTVRAAEMYAETFPERGPDRAGRLFRARGHRRPGGLRALSRAGGGAARSRCASTRRAAASSKVWTRRAAYAVLERHAPEAIRGYRNEAELRYLIGPGVSAAAIWHLRERLDAAGLRPVQDRRVVGLRAGKVQGHGRWPDAPIDVVGTGSYLPERWTETYATADIVEYDGVERVKVGREFLLRKREGKSLSCTAFPTRRTSDDRGAKGPRAGSVAMSGGRQVSEHSPIPPDKRHDIRQERRQRHGTLWCISPAPSKRPT